MKMGLWNLLLGETFTEHMKKKIICDGKIKKSTVFHTPPVPRGTKDTTSIDDGSYLWIFKWELGGFMFRFG